jgi:hypothetical protein
LDYTVNSEPRSIHSTQCSRKRSNVLDSNWLEISARRLTESREHTKGSIVLSKGHNQLAPESDSLADPYELRYSTHCLIMGGITSHLRVKVKSP